MANNSSSPRVWTIVDGLFATFSRIEPTTPRETNLHAEMLRRLNDLSDHRRLRLLSADNSVPLLMWGILILGGVITTSFVYLLGVESAWSHALMTAGLAAMIALTLYLIMAIDHPFAGSVHVEPDGFRLVLQKQESGTAPN